MSKVKNLLMEENGDGTGSTGGDDVAAKIKAAVDEAKAGLVAKNNELLAKLQKANDQLKSFDGIDPVKVKKLLEDMDADEDTKLIKDGKIDELLDRKYAKRDQEWQRKLDAALADGQKAAAKADKFLSRVLDDQLREAFTGKVDSRATAGALLAAKQIFKLDDEGRAVQFDTEGNVILGKDKTPFTPAEWIQSDATRKELPYLFPVTGTGSGATQSGAATSNVELMKMPAKQRMAAARKI